MKDLDRRLAALGRVEIDRDLTDLERDVWAKVDARARLRPLPNRLAALLCCSVAAAASITGIGAAAASARAPAEELFSIDAPLAPSALLSG